jgi:hypothetical protein
VFSTEITRRKYPKREKSVSEKEYEWMMWWRQTSRVPIDPTVAYCKTGISSFVEKSSQKYYLGIFCSPESRDDVGFHTDVGATSGPIYMKKG